MKRVFALAALIVVVAACHSDDMPPPDVFIDYDAHGTFPDGTPDGLPIDLNAADVATDAIDAIDAASGS